MGAQPNTRSVERASIVHESATDDITAATANTEQWRKSTLSDPRSPSAPPSALVDAATQRSNGLVPSPLPPLTPFTPFTPFTRFKNAR